MDGTLMNALHGNLNRLSEKNLRRLIKYYATGILSLPDQYLILNEIIGPKAMSLVLKAYD
jgi:hypothetical protein